MSLNLMNTKGVSLMELVIATVLVSAVVVSLALALPQASRSIVQTRQQTMAVSVAQNELEQIKSNLYDQLDTTDKDHAGAFAVSAPCDCAQVDYSALLSKNVIASRVSYTVGTCVSFVNPVTWTPQCLPNDLGYKNITVHVSWSLGGQTHTVTRRTIVSRT